MTPPELATRRQQFRQWRATRPFAGGVFLLISAAFLGLPAVTDLHLGELMISVSTIAGVSSVLLCVVMALCGAGVLVKPTVRVSAGVIAMVVALVAVPAANFGGYLLGTLAGIIGSALALSFKVTSTD